MQILVSLMLVLWSILLLRGKEWLRWLLLKRLLLSLDYKVGTVLVENVDAASGPAALGAGSAGRAKVRSNSWRPVVGPFTLASSRLQCVSFL